MEKIKCLSCGEEKRQNKHGKNKTGSLRYLCKYCNKAYTVNPKEIKYSEEKIKEAIKSKNKIYVTTLVSRDKKEIV